MRSYKTSQAKRTSYIYYSANGEKITITPDEGVTETHIELLHSLDDAEVNAQRRHYHMVPVHLDNYSADDDHNSYLSDEDLNLTEKSIICHSEGHKIGIASNHSDVLHWFPKHGKSMDDFRADVKAKLEESEVPRKFFRVILGSYLERANAEAVLEKARSAGFKDVFLKCD